MERISSVSRQVSFNNSPTDELEKYENVDVSNKGESLDYIVNTISHVELLTAYSIFETMAQFKYLRKGSNRIEQRKCLNELNSQLIALGLERNTTKLLKQHIYAIMRNKSKIFQVEIPNSMSALFDDTLYIAWLQSAVNSPELANDKIVQKLYKWILDNFNPKHGY